MCIFSYSKSASLILYCSKKTIFLCIWGFGGIFLRNGHIYKKEPRSTIFVVQKNWGIFLMENLTCGKQPLTYHHEEEDRYERTWDCTNLSKGYYLSIAMDESRAKWRGKARKVAVAVTLCHFPKDTSAFVFSFKTALLFETKRTIGTFKRDVSINCVARMIGMICALIIILSVKHCCCYPSQPVAHK